MELFLLIYFGIGLYFGGMVFYGSFLNGESRVESFLISLAVIYVYPVFFILAIREIIQERKLKK